MAQGVFPGATGRRLVLAEPYDDLPKGTEFTLVCERWPVLRPEAPVTLEVVLVDGSRRFWREPGPMCDEP